MSNDLDSTARELKEKFLVDRGLLKEGGRKEVLEIILRLRKKGRNAWVLTVPQDESLETYHALWDRLGLKNPGDLLLILNGKRWEARGWGLEGAEIAAILDSAEGDLRVYYGRGLTTALLRLAEKSDQKDVESSGSSLVWVGGLALVGVGAGLTFILRRRMRLQNEDNQKFVEAFQSAKQVCANVILSASEFVDQHPDAVDLQLKAMTLGEQLDVLAAEVQKKPDLKAKTKTLGRLQQIENELQVLMSTILQKTNEVKQSSEGLHVEGKIIH